MEIGKFMEANTSMKQNASTESARSADAICIFTHRQIFSQISNMHKLCSMIL